MRRLLPPIPRVKDPIGDSSQGDKMVRPRGHLGTRWPQPSPGRRALLWGLPGGGPVTQAQSGPGFLRTRSLVYSPLLSGTFRPTDGLGGRQGQPGGLCCGPGAGRGGDVKPDLGRGDVMARDANVFHGELLLWNESSFPAHSIKGVLPTPRPEGESRPSPHGP